MCIDGLIILIVGMFFGSVLTTLFMTVVLLRSLRPTQNYPTKEEWKAGKHAR